MVVRRNMWSKQRRDKLVAMIDEIFDKLEYEGTRAVSRPIEVFFLQSSQIKKFKKSWFISRIFLYSLEKYANFE